MVQILLQVPVPVCFCGLRGAWAWQDPRSWLTAPVDQEAASACVGDHAMMRGRPIGSTTMEPIYTYIYVSIYIIYIHIYTDIFIHVEICV